MAENTTQAAPLSVPGGKLKTPKEVADHLAWQAFFLHKGRRRLFDEKTLADWMRIAIKSFRAQNAAGGIVEELAAEIDRTRNLPGDNAHLIRVLGDARDALITLTSPTE